MFYVWVQQPSSSACLHMVSEPGKWRHVTFRLLDQLTYFSLALLHVVFSSRLPPKKQRKCLVSIRFLHSFLPA